MDIIYVIIIVAVLIVLVVVPLFVKVCSLRVKLHDARVSQKNLVNRYEQVLESRKAWEEELGLMIKYFLDEKELDFNSDLYLGAMLAHKRGYRLESNVNYDILRAWLRAPVKNDVYHFMYDILIDEIQNRKTLIGFNMFDNMARILFASAYKNESFIVMVQLLNDQDFVRVLRAISKAEKMRYFVTLF